jgi:hypothetical protein
MSVRTNEADLVCVSAGGQIVHPSFPGLPAEPYRLSAEGRPFLLPTFGGIVYNVSVGDRAFGWAADCIHPGVSIRGADDLKNRGLNVFACVGNEAVVMTGRAAGTRGVVTAKSGRFAEQLIVHFPRESRLLMAVGDAIVVRALGTGLKLDDHPEIQAKGLSPRLLSALPTRVGNDGRLEVGVTAIVPPHLVGAGAGLTSEGGSLHIQSSDKAELERFGLNDLRLGDVVAVADTDSRYNHGYLRGAMGIGVVGQGDGPRAGYGPGLTILLTAPNERLGAFEAAGTNISTLLDLEP